MGNATINKPFRVVCEGRADAAFFNGLFISRGILDFEAECAKTNGENKKCAGKSGITDTLLALKTIVDLRPGVLKAIVIAVDSDSDPEEAFKTVKESIRATKALLPVPREMLKPEGNDPAIAVVTIPWIDTPGHLDALLFESMRISHSDLMKPIDDFCHATEHRTVNWSDGSKAKMKLRCAIAACYKDDPGKSLAFVLESSACQLDFGDSTFDRIAKYFTDFNSRLS